MYYQDKETGRYVEMTTLLSSTSSVWVDLEEMPKYLPQAAVAIEDQRFYTHPGVDWKRTAKAVLDMFLGNDISGGSTITQQLIKNMTDYNETTVKRKVTEIFRAIRFTQNNSKDDTLEMYLNIIPLGAGCEGVGSASLKYFGKPVSELTLAECASLVGITNNPSKYGPYSFAKSKTSTGEVWDAPVSYTHLDVYKRQDENGTEYQRGTKAVTIPAHSYPSCRDVLVKCIKFVVPKDLDVSGGSTQTMCSPRQFKARFIAHNIDSDYRCCESVLTL